MGETPDILSMLTERFPHAGLTVQTTRDAVPTLWAPADTAKALLRFVHQEIDQPYRTLFDLTGIDERARTHRSGQPDSDFTVVYHLLSYARNADLRVKVPLRGDAPALPTVTDLWPSASWYERELWDMFGVKVDGHPNLSRILLPPWWDGHALRKDHEARATERPPFAMSEERQAEMMAMLQDPPGDWDQTCDLDEFECLYLNVGPHHPGTHGVLRVVLKMCGQEIGDLVCDIGYHHRGAEKMGERQSWHTYIPYTDRVDYLAGVLNNFPYVLAVEKLAGIEVPDRAKMIRILMAELFRINSHLVYLGTFAQDIGMMSPVFYMFTDRERVLSIVEAVTGARMHPSWFRIGGTAHDLPTGWEAMVRDLISYLRKRVAGYEKSVFGNSIFRARTIGVGDLSQQDAVDWGATGPMLRATGLAWDLRKARPYGGYDQMDFAVPTGTRGDCFDRGMVHLEEIRQSLRIIEQCLEHMPAGPYKADHPLTTPPVKPRTMHDIETLIDHFLGVSWGPVMPAGEAAMAIESSKGQYAYYLISDGANMSYRTRIRTPSFAHIQMVPMLSRGLSVPDLIAILASVDFVLAEVDR